METTKTSELSGAALDWAVAKCDGKTHGYAHHLLSYEDLEPLIAAMRCYVASKLGDTVEVPEELL